ncbi:MAG: hypothetical protein BroJett014_22890 [Planctomycetota bacterium]|nr:hypothetical protein [Planctomycetota bacterium]GIK53316.1 MAG: hypothetical protein BroJett014_22890 [Planctomycetota bacterium]
MSDRKKTIFQILSNNNNLNQLQLSREIKKQTGQGVAFPQLKKLREALAADQYDAVYDSLFASADAPVKRKPGRPRKEKAAAAEPAPEPAAQSEGAAAPEQEPAGKKQRGERRARYDVRGRRKADKNKIQLDDFADHLVVFRTAEGLRQETFKSRDRAEQKVRELLNAGHVATEIAYYRLNPLKTKVTVEIN